MESVWHCRIGNIRLKDSALRIPGPEEHPIRKHVKTMKDFIRDNDAQSIGRNPYRMWFKHN